MVGWRGTHHQFSTSKSPPIAAQLSVPEVKGQLESSNTHCSISSVAESLSGADGAGLQPGRGRGGAEARGGGVARANVSRLVCCVCMCVNLMRLYHAAGSPLHHITTYSRNIVLVSSISSLLTVRCRALSISCVLLSVRRFSIFLSPQRTCASASGACPVTFHTSPFTSTRCPS